MINRVNNISFSANLYTKLQTPEAKLFMDAAPEFRERTRKEYPNMVMYLKHDPINPDYPILTIGGKREYLINISNDFLKFDKSKNKKELVNKLVKAFKVMVADREMLKKLEELDDGTPKYEKALSSGLKKMEKIAGKDEGLQEYVGAVKVGMGLFE